MMLFRTAECIRGGSRTCEHKEGNLKLMIIMSYLLRSQEPKVGTLAPSAAKGGALVPSAHPLIHLVQMCLSRGEQKGHLAHTSRLAVQVWLNSQSYYDHTTV